MRHHLHWAFEVMFTELEAFDSESGLCGQACGHPNCIDHLDFSTSGPNHVSL